MGRYDKIEARVRVNGQTLQEYNTRTNDDCLPFSLTDVQINKSIESTPYANYEIEVITHPGFKFPQNNSWDILSFAIEIDGVKMCKTLNYLRHYEGIGHYREVIEGAESCTNGASCVQKFKFEPYKGDYTDSQPGNLLHSLQLGKIKIEVRREKLTSISEGGNISQRQLNSNSMPERLLKGRDIDTTTSLEAAQRHGNVWVMNTQRYDVKPMVTFNFHYASRNILAGRGILQEPTTPGSEDTDRPDTKHAQLSKQNRGPEIKVEENENAVELRRREARRARNLKQLERSTGLKRSRSPSPLFFIGNDDDDEIQEIKRPRLEAIPLIVLDD